METSMLLVMEGSMDAIAQIQIMHGVSASVFWFVLLIEMVLGVASFHHAQSTWDEIVEETGLDAAYFMGWLSGLLSGPVPMLQGGLWIYGHELYAWLSILPTTIFWVWVWFLPYDESEELVQEK